MAEHMTSNSHHDPAVGMHYMWNGGVDVSSFLLYVDLNLFLTRFMRTRPSYTNSLFKLMFDL